MPFLGLVFPEAWIINDETLVLFLEDIILRFTKNPLQIVVALKMHCYDFSERFPKGIKSQIEHTQKIKKTMHIE